MSTPREIEYRKQIEQLSQPDLVTILCATVSAIDDEHLDEALSLLSDNDLGTLVATGITEQRARENNEEDRQLESSMG
jgi:hypothetical protein